MHPLLQWQLAAQRRDGLLAEAQRRRLVRSITDHPESEARSFSVRRTIAAVVHHTEKQMPAVSRRRGISPRPDPGASRIPP